MLNAPGGTMPPVYDVLPKNLLTKYACPFPVTLVVRVVRILPSGLLIVDCRFLNLKQSHFH